MGILDFFIDYYLTEIPNYGLILNSVISAGATTLLFFPQGKKMPAPRALAVFFAMAAVSWLIDLFWSSMYYWLFPLSDLGYFLCPLFVLISLFFIFNFDKNYVERLVNVCVYVSVILYCTALLYPITYWEMRTLDFGNMQIFTVLAKTVLYTGTIVFLRRNKINYHKDRASRNFALLMIIISAIGYIMNGIPVAILDVPRDKPFSYNFFGSLALIVVEFLTYVMFAKSMVELENKRKLSVEAFRVKSELGALKIYEEGYDSVRSVRHDILNQYAYIGAMLHRGYYDKAVNYLDTLKPAMDSLSQTVYCGNNILNVAFNMSAAKAQKAGVKLDIKASVPKTLGVSDSALASITTNLLDNGIEACASLSEERRVVKVSVVVSGFFLLFHVVNPFSTAREVGEDGKLITSKKNKKEHGLGTQIISKLAESCGGCFNYELRKDEFIADVMLRCNSKDNGGIDEKEI